MCVCPKCIEEYEKHEKMMKRRQSFRSVDRHVFKVEINAKCLFMSQYTVIDIQYAKIYVIRPSLCD